jgi:hypothetical protein
MNTNRRKRGNKYTPFIHLVSMFLALMWTSALAPYLATTNIWATLARGLGVFFTIEFGFAILISLIFVLTTPRR